MGFFSSRVQSSSLQVVQFSDIQNEVIFNENEITEVARIRFSRLIGSFCGGILGGGFFQVIRLYAREDRKYDWSSEAWLLAETAFFSGSSAYLIASISYEILKKF